jgi:hypothetical protein
MVARLRIFDTHGANLPAALRKPSRGFVQANLRSGFAMYLVANNNLQTATRSYMY